MSKGEFEKKIKEVAIISSQIIQKGEFAQTNH